MVPEKSEVPLSLEERATKNRGKEEISGSNASFPLIRWRVRVTFRLQFIGSRLSTTSSIFGFFPLHAFVRSHHFALNHNHTVHCAPPIELSPHLKHHNHIHQPSHRRHPAPLTIMDLLTQLDSDIDLLLKIMSSSVAFISRKAKHAILPTSTVPLTILGKTEAIEPEEMDQAIAELVEDLIEKADSIRAIIRHLPTEESLGGDAELEAELERMEAEMKVVNDEYRSAVQEAERLRVEVGELVRLISERQIEGRAWLVNELDGGNSGEAVSSVE